MPELPYILLAIMPTLIFLGWVRTRLEYSVTEKGIQISLFGVCLRRIGIANVKQISKKRIRLTENWINTLKPTHKILTIHKRSGIFKTCTITPKNRYIFMAEVQKALQATGNAPVPGEEPDLTPVPSSSSSVEGRATPISAPNR